MAKVTTDDEQLRRLRELENPIEAKSIFSFLRKIQFVPADDERCQGAAIGRFHLNKAGSSIAYPHVFDGYIQYRHMSAALLLPFAKRTGLASAITKRALP